MAELHFNARGATHSLRLINRDEDGVWEAMVDTDDYVYFEAPEDAEIWYLINMAVAAYVEYRDNYETERRER
jgi:hypothetical protein